MDKENNAIPNLEKENPECSEVIGKETEVLKERRKLLFGEAAANEFDQNSFGLALSGGGIRSATINLGFMKTLNKLGLLKRADYLSTVSGGGYAGAYIQATLKGLGSELQHKDESINVDDCYEKLFSDEHIEHMRSRGEYLIPGKGVIKNFNRLVLIVAYLSSWIMSLLSPALMIAIAYSIYGLVSTFVEMDSQLFYEYCAYVLTIGAFAFPVVLTAHYILNRVEIYGLNISLWFHRAETVLLIALGFGILASAIAAVGLQYSEHGQSLLMYLCIGAGAIILGFFVNPNASSFHRFYRAQLSEAFLKFAGTRKDQNLLLKDLYPDKIEKAGVQDLINPYPLINTCLNLQATKDPKFQGTKTNDYFLLSPLYCGAKLTNYVETKGHNGYNTMTLPAATTISAAALNPGMGIYSNKILSVFLALFNARLGYWTWNPMKGSKGINAIWWPPYFFYELLSQIGTDKKMLNISDGGHIENLAVYELLRRKCKLIIAVDAGEDAQYAFSDLENLAIRSRNELGIEIRFLEGQDPEDIIRPKASFAYSRKRFAVAGLYKIWEEFTMTVPKGKGTRKVEVLVNYNHSPQPGEEAFSVCIKKEKNPEPSILKQAKKEAKERYERENPGKTGLEKLRTGTLVYVKSSVTAPLGKPNITPPEEVKEPSLLQQLFLLRKKKNPSGDRSTDGLNYAVYKYKIYHPVFPHEPTSDQFFDEVQWEAYYQLGQHLAIDMLGDLAFVKADLSYSNFEEKSTTPNVSLNDLMLQLDPTLAEVEEPVVQTRDLSSDTPRGIEPELPKAAEQETAEIEQETVETQQEEAEIQQEDSYYKI